MCNNGMGELCSPLSFEVSHATKERQVQEDSKSEYQDHDERRSTTETSCGYRII